MRIKKTPIAVILLLFVSLTAGAQDGNLVNIGLQARVDYQREYLGGDAVKATAASRARMSAF